MKMFNKFSTRLNSLFSIVLLLSFSLMFIHCSKDVDANEEANNKLDGNWDVESFRVDGVEQLLFTANDFDMEFRKEGDATGETEWTITDIFGGTTTIEGDYTIMNDGTRIDFEGDELNLEFNGDFLTIDGNVDGEFWEIDAEKN